MKIRRFSIALLLLAMLVSLVEIRVPAQSASMEGSSPKTKKYPFGPTDFVNVQLGKMKHRFFLGEPVEVSLKIINHTRFPATISTNLVPRSSLKVMIKPENQRSRQYYGPYAEGLAYSPVNYELPPLRQVTDHFLLWADPSRPDGIVFDEPGRYTISLSINVVVPEATINGTIEIPPFEIHVDPAPAPLEPLVKRLIDLKAFPELHKQRMSPETLAQAGQLIEGYPPSILTPYLAYAAAESLALDWKYARENKKQIADQALRYFQIAANSDSAMKLDAQMDLLQFLDDLGLGVFAEQTAKNLLRQIPADRRGLIGNSKLLVKYLHTTTELDLEKYWNILQ